MKPRFVHIYHVMRAKVAVVAGDTSTAIERAHELFARLNRDQTFVTDESVLPSDFEGVTHIEDAEEITGYMIDHEGDTEYEHSVFLDADGKPEPADSRLHSIVPAERDTIIAALRYWQRNVADRSFRTSTLPEWDIALNGMDESYVLTGQQIDDLCERLNV